MKLAVDGEWMIFAADAEDHVIAGQIDLYHHVFSCHLFQQFVRTIFVHYVHAVANALRVCLLDGQTNMTTKSAWEHQSGRKFPCVETDMDFGIEIVQETDYTHVQRVVSH